MTPSDADDIIAPPSGRVVEVRRGKDRFSVTFDDLSRAALISRYPAVERYAGKLDDKVEVVELRYRLAKAGINIGPGEMRFGLESRGMTFDFSGCFFRDFGATQPVFEIAVPIEALERAAPVKAVFPNWPFDKPSIDGPFFHIGTKIGTDTVKDAQQGVNYYAMLASTRPGDVASIRLAGARAALGDRLLEAGENEDAATELVLAADAAADVAGRCPDARPLLARALMSLAAVNRVLSRPGPALNTAVRSLTVLHELEHEAPGTCSVRITAAIQAVADYAEGDRRPAIAEAARHYATTIGETPAATGGQAWHALVRQLYAEERWTWPSPVSLAPQNAPSATRAGPEDDVVDTLGRLLVPGEAGRIVLAGPAGSGRAAAAARFAQSADGYRHRWRIRASTWSTLSAGIAARAADLGLPTEQLGNWLAANDGWLLIIDDCADPLTAAAIAPPSPRGHVIITSTSPDKWTDAGYTSVSMAPDSGAWLEQAGAGERAQEIAAALSRSTVATQLAAAYLTATRTSPSAYLEEIDELTSEPTIGDERESAVEQAITVALDRIEQTTPAAAVLLIVLSALGADHLPIPVIAGAPPSCQLGDLSADAVFLEKAIATLVSFGLITKTGSEFSVHPQIRLITLRRLRPDSAKRAAAVAVDTALAALHAAPTMNAALQLVRHVWQPVQERLKLAQMGSDDGHLLTDAAGVMLCSGPFYAAAGFFAAAFMAYSRSVEPDSQQVAWSQASLGRILLWAGQPAGARDHLTAAIAVLSADHQLDRWTALMRLDLAVAEAECGNSHAWAELAAARDLLSSDLTPQWSGTVELAAARTATALGDIDAARTALETAEPLFSTAGTGRAGGITACLLVRTRMSLLTEDMNTSLAYAWGFLVARERKPGSYAERRDLGLPSADSRLTALSGPILADLAGAIRQIRPRSAPILWLQASVSLSSAGNFLGALSAAENALGCDFADPGIREMCSFQKDRAAAALQQLAANQPPTAS